MHENSDSEFYELVDTAVCMEIGNKLQAAKLEPVCCKKQQKKVPDQLLVYRIGDL